MTRYIFDIETDGLLEGTTVVHSLCLLNIDTLETVSCCDQEGYYKIEVGLTLLKEADEVIGHNILKFDIPVLQKIFPHFTCGKQVDTLTLSRLLYADLFDTDMKSSVKGLLLQNRLAGRHSLEAWGVRLQCNKGDYKLGWKTWSKDMQNYCEQDLQVTLRLYEHLLTQVESDISLDLEHDFQKVIFQQELNGFPFDVPRAMALSRKLAQQKEELTTEIRKTIPDKITTTTFIPKCNRPSLGYYKDVPIVKTEVTPFNPGSRIQVANYFVGKGWKPEKFTDKDNISIDDEVLAEMPYPEAVPLAKYYEVIKILGYLSEGKKSWLNCVRNGKIHGGVITNGAVTGRVTHLDPNLGQIPSADTDLGFLCRDLFYALDPNVMVGADLSGVELRLLAHYLYNYDSGTYAKAIIHGDIHTTNQEAAGLPTRKLAKTFIYAFIYGAGNQKLGKIVEPHSTKEVQASIGKGLREQFLSKIPSIKRLMEDVSTRFTVKGYLLGLDGRRLYPRKDYSALNTLTQGAGAVIAKQWNVNFWKDIMFHVEQLAFVHDEIQLSCLPALAEQAGKRLVEMAQLTTQQFEMNCPITAEFKVAKTWAGAH